MKNTKMISSWILLATISSCLAFTLEQIVQNDELYVLKYPTKNELTCFSGDDDAALVWNDDLSTRDPSDDLKNFEPVKPIENILLNSGCAIWKSRQCFIEWSTSHDWKKVSSLTHPMAPVYDFRWEGFKEYVVDAVEPKNVLSLDAEDGTIIFSIRATNDVQIRLCEDTEVGLSPCFVIKFAVDGSSSSIKYCESRETRCYEEKCTAPRIPAFLDADEWRTIRLQWIKNERKIKVFRERYEYVFLESTLGESQFIRNILISSSALARIRFHDYNYNLATNQNSTLATKEFDWLDDSFCVKMLISLCPECYLTVNLIDRSFNETLANKNIYRNSKQYYSSGLREWQSIKLTLPSERSSQRQVQLQFEAGLNNNNWKDVWWAIDDLRLCEQNDGVRKSTIKLPSSDQTGVGTNIKCQKLLRYNIAVADSSTSLPSYLTTRLTQYITNLTKSHSPGCRVSNTTNCDDIDSTSDRKNKSGNESEARPNHPLGIRCFHVKPGKTIFTLNYISNSLPCREVVGRFSLSVSVRQGHLQLGRQLCPTIPCRFHTVSLQPFTTYNVVVESHSHGVVFNENITTLESAPPAVTDVQIHDADAFRGTISVTCKPPYPPYGKIEFYRVSIMNKRQEILETWLINVSKTKTCEQSYVCIENLFLPSNISTDDNLKLQILAKNANVSAGGAVSLKAFQLNNLYNKAPEMPQKLQANPENHGIVMLTWSHPSFTPTKIVRFQIQADCLSSNLTTHSCKNISSFYYTITNAEEKSYSMELHLQTSTKYRLHVIALNYRNKISTPIMKDVSTSASVSFARKDELRIINGIDVVVLEIPAVLNATRYTTIVIKVEGLSLCALNTSRNESSSKNKTKITMNWDAIKYSVNSDQPFNFTFDLNKHYGGQKICRSQRMETYRFVVTLTDPALKKPLILETTSIAFTDEKSPPEQIKTWPVILIPILVICWCRKHKKTKMQTIDSQGVPFDLRSSIPVNSRVQSGDAQDPPANPVHTASSENLEGQTSCAQNDPLEPLYMIPRNLSEQATCLQNVALAPVYMNIPNDSRQESSYGENVTSDPEYWEILDNSWEQPSHRQDVALAPLYMSTFHNSKGESSYPRDASLDPEYLTIMDDLREETSYAQDVPLLPM